MNSNNAIANFNNVNHMPGMQELKGAQGLASLISHI